MSPYLVAAVTVMAAASPALPTVQVVLDMDARTPGLQASVTVAAGTTVVEDIAVYVFEPSGAAPIVAVGYLGGIDRGISLGHMPAAGNRGAVAAIEGAAGAPLHPGNTAFIVTAPGLDPGFAGPEIQYVEFGEGTPAFIPAAPRAPILTADIVLASAAAGDVYDFFLLDRVTVWSGGDGGAFSTTAINSLDSGGDAVPDGTLTLFGIDPDGPIPVPPAAYAVDYIDGPQGGGPATIAVVTPGDLDGNGAVDVLDLLELLAAWGPCPPAPCPADVDGSGAVGVADLLILLSSWTG